MPGIDNTLYFGSLNVAILTISDVQNSEIITTGESLKNRIIRAGHKLIGREWVNGDIPEIANRVQNWSVQKNIDVVLTCGGTGFKSTAVTIEAVTPLLRKTLPGFSNLYHQRGFKTAGLSTLQSRVCAGLIGETLVFCLPGATDMAEQAWDDILQYALDSRYRPSSLVDLLPRLME